MKLIRRKVRIVNKTMFSIKQQANKPNVLDIYIYDNVEGDSYNWWTGEKMESETSANYIKQVLESNQSTSEINLYINSYGGEVKEGLGIYNQLKRHPAQVNVYIDGFACSIASVIAMVGDKVVMGTNALMMIHHASIGCYGNAEELRKAANDVEVIDQASCSSYLTKAGEKLDEATLKQLLDNQTWLNASQCLEYGLCDEIAGQEDKTIEAAQQRFKQSIQAQIMQAETPIKVPKQFEKQRNNYEILRQKFMKKEGNK